MYLGLDLGTSGLRGLLVDDTGAPVDEAQAHYDVAVPHQGWSEQNPQDWIDALKTVMGELKSRRAADVAAVKAIGISGHMHGATVIDETGAIIRPSILWNDTRAHIEAAELDAIREFRALSGNVVFPGFTAPKLMWMARNEPDLFARVDTVFLPKDYLGFWLSGEKASEMSDAAGTSWLDVGARAWSSTLLEKSGMRSDQMPRLVEGSEVIGTIRPEVADELGLPATTKLVGGGGDNAAAACGIGALAEGQGFASLGTSGVLLSAKGSYAPDAASAVHTFCHAVPDRWYQMGVILSATDSMNWLAEITGSSPAELSSLLPNLPDGPHALRFAPYLSGERTPHNDPSPRGAFLGLSKSHGRADLTQAVMEGVNFALRDSLEALRGTGTNPTSLMAIGGGTHSAFWLQSLANCLGLPLELPEKGDFGAALGAARLAMIGDGHSVEEVITPPKTDRVIEPNTILQDDYEAAYAAFAKTYSALKDLT